MGCHLLGCSNNTAYDVNSDNNNNSPFYEIESNQMTYRSKGGTITDRSCYLTNTSSLFTDNNNERSKPIVKRLNFSKLKSSPQLSDRSFNSKLTMISEAQDKVLNLLSERNGKTFTVLSKEFNYSLKLIKKLNTYYLSSNINDNNEQINISICSEVSECKGEANRNNKSLIHNDSLKNNVNLFNKFKTLFYIPLISLTGEIENYFSISNIASNYLIDTAHSVNDVNSIMQLYSFSVYFDFFETFFSYVFNLFHNLHYNSKSYKNEFIKLSSCLMEIQKINISFYPNTNYISLSFYYLSDEFYSFFLGDCNTSFIDCNEINYTSKSIEKECLTITFSTSEQEKQNLFYRYKILYRNINMSNNDCLKILEQYLNNKVKKNELIQQFILVCDKHINNCGFVVGFAIYIDEYKSNQIQNCVGFEIKIKTNHDWLVGEKVNEINDKKESLNWESDGENVFNMLEEKCIGVDRNYIQVRYLVIQVVNNVLTISYEYSFK